MIVIVLCPSDKRSPERTELYDIEMDGVVIGSHRDPEFHACRILLEQGVVGEVGFFRRGKTYPSMVLDIEKGAKFVTNDNRKSLHIGKYVPFEGVFADAEPTVIGGLEGSL